MPESNVELSRYVIEAYSARDLDELIAYCDPSIEFHSALAAALGTIYHGTKACGAGIETSNRWEI